MSKQPTLGAPLLDAGQAAAQLGISLRTLRTLIAAGSLPVVRLSPRCVRLRPEDLAAFIESRLAGGGGRERR